MRGWDSLHLLRVGVGGWLMIFGKVTWEHGTSNHPPSPSVSVDWLLSGCRNAHHAIAFPPVPKRPAVLLLKLVDPQKGWPIVYLTAQPTNVG